MNSTNLTELRASKKNLEWELDNGSLFQASHRKDLKKVNAQLKQALEAKIAELKEEIKTSIFATGEEEKELKGLKVELTSL